MATSEIPVFLETSLGTRIIVGVNSDDTVESLKRKIVANHTVTFPDIGDIIVKAVKICRQGKMYHLSDLMPVCTLHNGMSEPLSLNVEAVTERQGRKELNVPVGGRVEDLIMNEVPHTDLADPLHAPANELRKTEKKKHRKLYAEGTSRRLAESRKSEDEKFEGSLAHEEPGCMTSNVQASNLANSNLVSFHGENKCANGGQIKQKESREEEQTCVEDGDKSDKRGKRMIAKVQQPVNDTRLAIGEPDNTKESTHEAGLVEVEDLSGKSLGQDFVSPQIPGAAIEMPNSISSQCFKSRQEPEGNSRADKDTRLDDGQIPVPNDMEEHRLDEASKNVLKESTHVVDGDPGVVFGEKKKRKKKAAISEFSTKELSSRENESCKEKESNSVLDKEMSKVRADDILDNAAEAVKDKSKKRKKTTSSSILLPLGEDGSEKADDKVHNNNQIIEKQRDSEIQQKSAEAVKDKSKKKRKKTASSSNILPLGEDDSKKAGDEVHKNNQITEKQRGSEIQKKSDDVAFLAPKFTDPDDSINKASDILADLKRRSPLQPDAQIDVVPQKQLLANVAVDHHKGEVHHVPIETKKKRKSGKKSTNNTETSQNTMNALTGESVIALDEKKTHVTEKTFSPSIRDIGIETRNSVVLAISQKDCARDQKRNSNVVDNSVGDGKKRKRKKQEATNSGAQANIEGIVGEVNGSVKNLASQIDASGKQELQIKIQRSLKKDSIPADMSFGDGKSSKGKSKEKGVTGKLGDASLADGTNQDAPNTPEKVRKSAESYNKEVSTEAAQTKGPEVLQAPTTEKVNFIDYFLHEGANQPDDTSAPLKETKGRKKIESKSFSRDSMSASVDTMVSAETKKADGKVQIMKNKAKSSKEHIPNETSNDKSRVLGDDGGLKKDNNMKSLLADMTVTSDASTEDEKEAKSQLRPMVAVRKVASKAIGKKIDASRKTSPVFSSSSLPGDMRSDASTGDGSGSVNRGSPMSEKEKGRGTMSPSSHWKDVQLADDDMPMSQEPARPKKKVDLNSILRSSSSYKKAKVSLSQSQAEDHDMIAVVFETQQDSAS